MKDPAFLFYSSDFLSGVTDLTMEERGQYITLLCIQHQKGELTDKTIRLTVGSVSVDVLAKFQKSGDVYKNLRLESEILKRLKFTESRRLNGQKGGRPKASDKPLAKPLGKPKNNLSENEDINDNDILIDNKNQIKIGKPKNGHRITVKAKYLSEPIKIVYDLEKYFDYMKQLPDIRAAGWKDFDGFMDANPAAIFEDDSHLYNSFRLYSTKPKELKNKNGNTNSAQVLTPTKFAKTF